MADEKTLDTKQSRNWAGVFGKEYTDRNALTLEGLDKLYEKRYGITRTALNKMFVGHMERSIRILEVGSNVGNQLLNLQKMGFEELYGIEINTYAIELSKLNTQNINIVKSSAFDLPFKDNYFDLVFTSGLLIHIAPSDIGNVLEEIYRCAREYIWGFEYYAEEYTKVMYRGQNSLLWRANFAGLYLERFDALELIKEKRLKYLENDNVDTMFLIKKKR